MQKDSFINYVVLCKSADTREIPPSAEFHREINFELCLVAMLENFSALIKGPSFSQTLRLLLFTQIFYECNWGLIIYTGKTFLFEKKRGKFQGLVNIFTLQVYFYL